MRKSLVIHVAGTPRPQPRPRFVRGRVVSTANPKAKLWRAAVDRAVREAIVLSHRTPPLFTGAVRLSAVFVFEPAKGNEHLLDLPHTLKPDADNLLKCAMDVLESAGVFDNDCKIYSPHTAKWWGEKAGMQILIEDASEDRRAAPSKEIKGGEAPGWLAGADRDV